MDENKPRDPHPGLSFAVTRDLLSSYVRAVGLDEQIARAAEASQYESIELARAFAVGAGRFTPEFTERSLVAELATTLGLHEATASTLLHEAESLVNHFPDTLRALGIGAISRQHVRVLLGEAWSLPAGMGRVFEQMALPLAEELTPSRFRREARKLRDLLHPDAIAERLRLARTERKMVVEPGHDGMSWITLYLPTDQAATIAARLDSIARRTASPDDARTRAQREVDIASDLLQFGGLPGGSGADHSATTATAGTCGCVDGVGPVRPTVFVTVPVLTLMGLSEEPGSLEGFGPIDADTARELAADAPSFFRILTHPETGTWMSYGRDAYKVPADLQRYIRLRDGVCRFPGCTHRAVTGENDHTVDWQEGGITSVENLASLCKKHHRLKHNSDWHVAQLPEGVIEWTSPAGRTYRTRPDSSFGGIRPDLLKPEKPSPKRSRTRVRAIPSPSVRSGRRSTTRSQPSSASRLTLPSQLRQQLPQLPQRSPLPPLLPRRAPSKRDQAHPQNDDDPPF